jgi:hypothetical protein
MLAAALVVGLLTAGSPTLADAPRLLPDGRCAICGACCGCPYTPPCSPELAWCAGKKSHYYFPRAAPGLPALDPLFPEKGSAGGDGCAICKRKRGRGGEDEEAPAVQQTGPRFINSGRTEFESAAPKSPAKGSKSTRTSAPSTQDSNGSDAAPGTTTIEFGAPTSNPTQEDQNFRPLGKPHPIQK